MTARRSGLPCPRCLRGQIVRLGLAPASCLQCSYGAEDDDVPHALSDIEDADERDRFLDDLVRLVRRRAQSNGVRL